MSILVTATVICGCCGAASPVKSAASVNADRRPDLRAAILEGRFQAATCPACGSALRLPAHMTYLHLAAGQWILVDGPERLADWAEAETEAQAAYDGNFGPDASEGAQAIGQELTPRLVFGWPALREKLCAADLGLDDTALELTKMAILRGVDAPPFSDDTELRLVGGDAEHLRFEWLTSTTEAWLSRLEIDRTVYAEIAADDAGWAPVRAELDGHLFVDMARLIRA